MKDCTERVLIGCYDTKHSMLAGVVGLALGDHHSVIFKQDGSVWSTVFNHHERHSLNELIFAPRISKDFTSVISRGAMAVATGTEYTMVLKQDGSVWTVGYNRYGQLGIGSKKRTFVFVQVMTGVKAVAAGSYHSMIVTEEGRVWTAGWNKYGQLGDGMTGYRSRFFATMSSGAKAVAVAAGDPHSIVLKQDGSLWAAGRNNNGQLGDGTKADQNSFVEVMHGDIVDMAAGGYHSIVVCKARWQHVGNWLERIWPAR